MGSTWRRRGSGQTHGTGVQQRPSETAGRGCAEAHRLKSPGAAALLAIGGPGAARLGRSEASGSPESGGSKAWGAKTTRACRGRGRAEDRRRAGAGGLAKALQFAEARERAGPGSAQAAVDLEPGIRKSFLPRRTRRALPRPTREPRSHHLARRAALAAGGGCGFRGTRRRRLAVRRRLGCNGAWTRSEAGRVRAGEASEGGEGCSLTHAHERPRLAAAARC